MDPYNIMKNKNVQIEFNRHLAYDNKKEPTPKQTVLKKDSL